MSMPIKLKSNKFSLICHTRPVSAASPKRPKHAYRHRRRRTLISVAALIFLCATTAFSAPEPTLRQSELPAIDEQSTILSVSKFGRYAVTVDSEQGSALQLVDRMTGPDPIQGTIGERNGRLDLFLEKGDYKIIAHSHPQGQGTLKLQAHAYSELQSPSAPRLVELKPVQSNLRDFQQRSYWITIKQRRAIAIEAAGRSLGDMRLWKDGDWLIDAMPNSKVVTPQSGKPLSVYQLNTYLEPGLYLLTIYGGPAQTWSETSDEHPLYIRYGIPKLAVADRSDHQVSPFGSDRWLVPKPANFFRLAIPEARDTKLTVNNYSETSAFDEGGYSSAITKKSNPPVTEIDFDGGANYRLVTIEGDAGQAYALQHFESANSYQFDKSGKYWISTLHSGHGADSIDATTIMTATPYGGSERYLDSRAVSINKEKAYRRKFNLLDRATIYLQISETGRYTISASGKSVDASFKLEPFLLSRPYNYRSPPFENSGHTWDVDAGFYVLTIKPRRKGIATVTIRGDDYQDGANASSGDSVASSSRYNEVYLQSRTRYQLYLNNQPGVRSGMILRRLPIKLSEGALPVDQRAGEKLTIPITVSEAGIVRALDVNGKALPFSIDGDTLTKAAKIEAGRKTITIDNPGKETLAYSLRFAAQRLAADTPLPSLAKADADKRPNFPNLSNANPIYFDLYKNQTATYNVQVNKPALYRLETAGLLNTEGNLRTRTQLSLIRQQSNGVGRNFLIQQYLNEGDYQLSVKALGESQGHNQLSLQQTDLIDNGQLADGIVARYTLTANRGLQYRFNIQAAGEYRLRALGPGESRLVRLEDIDGWPIITPGSRGDLQRVFKPGDYRLIILPSDTDSRVISLLEQVPTVAAFNGHGPHQLPLNRQTQHVWLEPDGDAPRTPDQWLFRLPASADVQVLLDNEMDGELQRVDDGTPKTIAQLNTVKPWRGRLKSGQYQLLLRNHRKNNRVEYNLQVNSEQLLPGQARDIALPSEVSLALENSNSVELSAFASGDIRAWLYRDNGQLIAKNDDRQNDWNFLIARPLDAGIYRLRVEALDTSTQSARIMYRVPKTKQESALSLPANGNISDDVAHIYPLNLTSAKALLSVNAESTDTLGIAVEMQQQSQWRSLGSSINKQAHLLIPITELKNAQLRLRVWSVDRRGADIRFNTATYNVDSVSENRRKLTLERLGKHSPFVAAAMKISQPGVFAITGEQSLLAAGQSMRPLNAINSSAIAVNGDTLWLAALTTDDISVQVKRLALTAEKNLQLTLPAQDHDSYLDVEPGDGPLLVIAESLSGQVGAQLLADNAGLANMSFSERGMVTSLLSADSARVKLWNGDQPGQSLEVSMRAIRLKYAKPASLAEGVTDAPLAAASAQPYHLPAGIKQLRISLPAHTAAVFSNGNTINAQYWSGDNPANVGVQSEATQLSVLYAGGEPTQFHLEMNLQNESARENSHIRANAVYRLALSRSGILQIPVELPNKAMDYVLQISGDLSARFIQNDGVVLRGKQLALTNSGTLTIRHKPGRIIAWLQSTGTSTEVKASRMTLDKPIALTLNDDLPAQLVSVAQNSVLHLYSDKPLITHLRYASGEEHVLAHPHGIASDIYLPQGETLISFSALAGDHLSGKLNLSTSPLITIGEGIGPARMIAAGGGQLFTFTLVKNTTVGIGLQASSGQIRGILMDINGVVIGEGPVQMRELKAGRYVLAAYADADLEPMFVRPVLIGTEVKDTSPPPDVIRQYLQAAGIKMSEDN